MSAPISPLFLVPGLLGGTLSLWMAAVTARKRPGVGWQFLVGTGIAVAVWCLGQVAWVLAATEAQVWRIAQIQYCAISASSVLWLLHAMAQTGRARWVAKPATALIALFPALTLVIAFTYVPGETNPLWHGFTMPPDSIVPGSIHGPWFWFFTVHTHALLLAGCVLLLRYYSQSELFREELLLTGVMPLSLLAVNALFITGYWPLPLDPSPLGFGVGFAVFGWAMERRQLFETRPIGRRMAFDSLQEGIVIVDVTGRIIEVNPAAARLLGTGTKPLIGRPLREIMPVGEGWGESMATLELDLAQVEGRAHRLQVNVAPIRDESGRSSGSVMTVRDVTRERTAQHQLLTAHRHLRVLNRELKRIARIDPLTGLANRRVLVERLDQEFARARRYSTPLAVLMIDLDHFKQVNDTRGHLIGDAVLGAVANALDALKRPADLAARYGGEEMILLLPETDAEGARGAAERVWQALRGIVHRDAEQRPFSVSASLGLATLHEGDARPQDLVARADTALYAAKHNGRDRIAVARADGGVDVFKPGAPASHEAGNGL